MSNVPTSKHTYFRNKLHFFLVDRDSQLFKHFVVTLHRAFLHQEHHFRGSPLPRPPVNKRGTGDTCTSNTSPVLMVTSLPTWHPQATNQWHSSPHKSASYVSMLSTLRLINTFRIGRNDRVSDKLHRILQGRTPTHRESNPIQSNPIQTSIPLPAVTWKEKMVMSLGGRIRPTLEEEALPQWKGPPHRVALPLWKGQPHRVARAPQFL